MNNWYLYVNKVTLTICKVSPALEQDDECHVIAIDKELGVSFIDSPHLFRSYLVYYDGTKAHFVKKEKANEMIVPIFYTPLLIPHNVKDPELNILYSKNELKFVLKQELIQYATSLYGNVKREHQIINFYVSDKNDPNGLIDILKVDMMKLILTGTLTVPFEYDLKKVSIFTRKAFESYSLNKNKEK